MCRTFFPKAEKDYAQSQPRYTLLKKEKINIVTGEVTVQYGRLTPKTSRRHPYNGWLGTLAVSPCYQTASQGALDFLFVQVTIALDALLMPLKGRSYYFDSVPLKGSSYSFTLNLSCMIS